MKKIILLIVFLSIPVYAEYEILGEFGPATSTSNVTIPAPGADKQLCLSYLDIGISAYGANLASLRVLDGGTTIYHLIVSTTSGLSSPNPIKISDPSRDPLCASSNNFMVISSTATTFSINYQGHIRKTR